MSADHSVEGAEVTHQLKAGEVFGSLIEDEAEDGIRYRAYAHYLSRACWHGCRIILRQTSPESEGIFDLILELHKACNGQWDNFLDYGIEREHLNAWLEYAGMFMSSLGNHYVSNNSFTVSYVYGLLVTIT